MKQDLYVTGLTGGENSIVISWAGPLSGKFPGFGTVTFEINPQTGELVCDNEFVSTELVSALLDLLKGAKLRM